MTTDLGAATEHDMVAAFLKAEIVSPRFGPVYRRRLQQHGWDQEALVDAADLRDQTANSARRQLLGEVRGYARGAYLFRGFPDDVRWRLIELSIDAVDGLKYANHPTWLTLSAGSRLVGDGARLLDRIPTGENANAHIHAVAAQVEAGTPYPALIAVEGEGGSLILVEGHTRATAYAVVKSPPVVMMLVGASPSMNEWAFY